MIPTAIFGLSSIVLEFVLGDPKVVFDWLVAITGMNVIFSWMCICGVHLRFRAAFVAQGFKLSDLPYVNPCFPYGNYIAMGGMLAVIVGQFTAVSDKSNILSWLQAYVGIFPFPLIYLVHKLVTGSKIVPLTECDFITGNMKMEARRSMMSYERKSNYEGKMSYDGGRTIESFIDNQSYA